MISAFRIVTLWLLLLSVAAPAWAASTTLVIFPVIRAVEAAPAGQKTTISVDKLVRIVASRERRKSLESVQLPAQSLVGRSRISKQSIVALLQGQPEIAGSEIVGPDWITVVAPGHAETQAKVITEAADPEANIIFGAVINDNYNGEMKVTVIATGFSEEDKKKPGHASLMRQTFGMKNINAEEGDNDLETPAFLRKKLR